MLKPRRQLMTLSRQCRFVDGFYVSAARPGKKVKFSGDGRCELDSHADTCCAGADCHVESTTGETVSVYPFSAESNKVSNVPIGTVVYAVDDPRTGRTVLLVMHEVLIFGDRLPISLINPNQLRDYGVQVNDVPRQFDESSSHSIVVPRKDDAHDLRIPLEMKGVISYFDCRKPTPDELQHCERLQVTSSNPWDPSSKDFAEKEEEARRVSSIRANLTQEKEEDFMSKLQQLSNIAQQMSVERMAKAARICSLKAEVPMCLDETENAFIPGNDAFIPEIAAGNQRDLITDRLISSVQISSCDTIGDGIDGYLDERNPLSDFITPGFREVCSLAQTQRGTVLTKEVLARRWGLSLETAGRTLNVTTQKGIRTVPHPVERRFKSFSKHLNYPTLKARYYSDTMFAKYKSLRGKSCGQVFTDGMGDTHIYPLRRKREAGHALKSFIMEHGAFSELLTDQALEEGQRTASDTLWNKLIDDYMIKLLSTAPYSQFQNRAESEIRELKRGTFKFLRAKKTPKRLWCYCAEWYAAVRRFTALDFWALDGRVPAERRLGNTPDISEHAQFEWYEFVKYHEPGVKDGHTRYGRFIGVCKNIGTNMTFWILTDKCSVISRDTVSSLTDEERRDENIQRRIAEFDQLVDDKIGDRKKKVEADEFIGDGIMPTVPSDDLFDYEDDLELEQAEPEAAMPEVDDYTPDCVDNYLTAEVLLPRGGVLTRGKVIRRATGPDEKPIGLRNSNPILDTRSYEVQFADGEISTYQANMIAEHMFSQVDSEGHELQLLEEIVDHRTNGDAISKDEGYEKTRSGNMIPKKTTKGWELLVNWKDKSTSWVKLKDIKESHPVQVAEYAVNNKIAEEPAFKWWVTAVLRKRDRIISKVKSAYHRRTHKYGIRVPKTVEEAYQIDEDTGTTYWRDAIEKEMANVRVAFDILEDGKVPIGYKPVPIHMVFDIKMMTLQRKARLVAGGHKTDPPKEAVYSSVVSRESVRLALLAAALNDLDIMAADIQNAYLTAPTKEKLYCECGPEFGSDSGKIAVVVRALYGLRSSGKQFRDFLAKTLREDLKFVPCKADPDVWMRKATKADGFQYWEYILCYVDDLLSISENPKRVLDEIEQSRETFTLKPGSVKEPDVYLGAQISKHFIEESDTPTKTRWAMSSDSYVKTAVETVERSLKDVGMEFLPKKRIESPITPGYRPELDSTAELDPRRLNYYQGLIGVLRWICELGRLDIVLPVSLLSRYLANPRWGHLEQALHIFAYLKKYNR